MIRWLRRRQAPKDHLVVSWSGQTLAYVLARGNVDLGYEVLKSGVERQGEVNLSGGLDDMVRRLKALSLDGLPVSVMLRPEQYQLLRIRAPAVAPDELRAAARFQILKMLDTHIDDVTIDVMRVGDGRARGAGHLGGHLFVVAARRMVIREVLDLCDAMRWNVSVIDIQETAQRNLQTALAIIEGQGRRGRASAALVLLDPLQAVLTICAEGELFYARRFDLPRGFLAGAWEETPAVPPAPARWGDEALDLMAVDGLAENDQANRFLLEVQRSLDLWDRVWSSLPLDGISLYAGNRGEELAGWLTRELGQVVRPMDLTLKFPEFKGKPVFEEAPCLPLLGLLLRTESKSL